MPALHRSLRFLIFALLALLSIQLAQPQSQPAMHGYQRAPKPIPELLDAPPTPLVVASPNADRLLVVDRLANPPVADLAQPMLRIAG